MKNINGMRINCINHIDHTWCCKDCILTFDLVIVLLWLRESESEYESEYESESLFTLVRESL